MHAHIIVLDPVESEEESDDLDAKDDNRCVYVYTQARCMTSEHCTFKHLCALTALRRFFFFFFLLLYSFCTSDSSGDDSDEQREIEELKKLYEAQRKQRER
jgi:hypothetical protein